MRIDVPLISKSEFAKDLYASEFDQIPVIIKLKLTHGLVIEKKLLILKD